jgi:hypothetical protein
MMEWWQYYTVYFGEKYPGSALEIVTRKTVQMFDRSNGVVADLHILQVKAFTTPNSAERIVQRLLPFTQNINYQGDCTDRSNNQECPPYLLSLIIVEPVCQ